MDERGTWDPSGGPTAGVPEPARTGDEAEPLTRRELRARAEARRAAEEDDGSPEGPPVAPAPDLPEEDTLVRPPVRPEEPTDVDLTVELPAALSDEPEVDDVRWDAPFPPVGHVPRPEARWPAAPLREQMTGAPGAPADPVPAEERTDGGTSDVGTTADGAADTGDPAGAGPEAREPAAGDSAVALPWDHGIGDSFGPPVGGPPSSARDATGPTSGTPNRWPDTRPSMDPAAGGPLPTLDDLLAARPQPSAGPAELGWQATVRRLTGGLVTPGPGAAERRHREAVAAVQRSLDGPRTVVVINPKGGAHKTTASLLIAATFGIHRGGYTLAWDNNETRGTLGWRSQQARHHNTAVNLLQDLERFSDPGSARVGDLDNYVRAQGSARFDVLASDEDAASAASIDAFAFRSLHRTLSRFYRIMVVDTGNNMRASNWQAAVEAADQVVIVSTVREDTAQSAAWAVDAMRATGHGDAVSRAVTVLSSPAPRRDDALAGRLHEHFGRLTRAVIDVPYDPALVAGGPVDFGALSAPSREAWLHVTATVADGL